jgi:hypothetical protein
MLSSASRCCASGRGPNSILTGKIRCSDLDSEVGLRRRQSLFGGLSFPRDRVSLFGHAVLARGARSCVGARRFRARRSRSAITVCRTCRGSTDDEILQPPVSSQARSSIEQAAAMSPSIVRVGAMHHQARGTSVLSRASDVGGILVRERTADGSCRQKNLNTPKANDDRNSQRRND